ncbi:MAG: hypothetical protein ABIX01_08875 [Chitinophagaceae bacterium]
MKNVLLQKLTLFAMQAPAKATLTTAQWKEEMHYPLQNMDPVHLNPYHTTSKKTLKNFVAALDKRIDRMRMVAMVKDGHTAIKFFNLHHNGNGVLPMVNCYTLTTTTNVFDAGIFFTGTSDDYKAVVGKRIIQVVITAIQTFCNQLADPVLLHSAEGNAEAVKKILAKLK